MRTGCTPFPSTAIFPEKHGDTASRWVSRFVLFHTSNLWDLVRPYDARTWGENIAYADTLRRVEQLWMQSYHHRVNLLNPSFRSAGIGVARAKGWLWVTLQLYG